MEKLHQSLQGISFYEQMDLCLSSQDRLSELGLKDMNMNSNLITPPQNPNLSVPSSSLDGIYKGDNQEDYDFSDFVLNYINQVLMEEDGEDKSEAYEASSALEATEKSLYEAIGKEYPQPQNHNENYSSAYSMIDPKLGGFNTFVPDNLISFDTSSSLSNGHCRVPDLSPTQSCSSSYNSVANSWGLVIDGQSDSPRSHVRVPDMYKDSNSIIQFNKGVEVASRFLPHYNSLYVTNQKPIEHPSSNLVASWEKKQRHQEDLLIEEGRGRKLCAVSEEADERQEVYDMVLLCSKGKNDAALRESLQNGMNKNVQTSKSKGGSSKKGRGKKKGGKKDVVVLSSLLSQCAQATAANYQSGANELLKKIRQHSSPTGDGNQRMAHYFANGLEARLAGAGSPIYTFLMTGRTSAADLLRAYHLYLATCPYKKLSNFFSNKTIMAAAKNAKRVHIIDLGIVFGFQWPALLQHLSEMDGCPPNLRITGIDLPLPGFRPAKRVEETGVRLTKYAERFRVPFEYNAVAKRWEDVTIDDLKIEKDEVVIVNSMYRFHHVQDEDAIAECPRNIVLNLIKKINPQVFILGVVNGAFGAPFFTTRFREALFHYSTLFDMLEAVAPRESDERAILEREIFGRQAMNVIACEGVERVERPETYKQWQVRNERIGLRLMPLDKEIVSKARERMTSCYHKDFAIDIDGQWMLQGWKGRIVLGVPNHLISISARFEGRIIGKLSDVARVDRCYSSKTQTIERLNSIGFSGTEGS
ncbi:hypothetical protein V2J09_023382 [Rumex salicifolius]